MSPTPVVICVDLESDATVPDRTGNKLWSGCTVTHRILSDLRPRAAAASGEMARFAWFVRMDPSVGDVHGSPEWPARELDEQLRDAREHGDGIGLHVHASRWDDSRSAYVSDFADQAWIAHCVKTGFQAFVNSFGRSPTTFRFGNHWMNDATWKLLEELGVRVDVTVEPGVRMRAHVHSGEPLTGSLPGYFDVPRVPYRPTSGDFRRPAKARTEGPWILPISSAPLRDEVPDPSGALSMATRAPELGNASYRTLSLSIDPTEFATVAHRCLRSIDHPVLVCPLRTDMVLDRRVERVRANLEWLLALTKSRRIMFSTAEAAIEVRERCCPN